MKPGGGANWLFAGLVFGSGEAMGPDLAMTGGIAMVSGDEAVRQSIMLLLSTIPGERVMRAAYGCPLHRIMFNPNDATTAGLAIHYVREALSRFEPRVEILHLDARADDGGHDGIGNPSLLDIMLEYRVRESQATDNLAISLDLAGET